LKPQTTTDALWPEAMATVTACRYEFGAGRALAFGAPSSKRFHISFNYWANDELHTGEFYSDTALPQGHLFPITYNPAAPQEHSQSDATSVTRSPVLAIGVIGSILLSLAWFALMRSCH
jgi:hypothetical protein